VVGAFPDGQSALNLAAARLRHIAGTALKDQEREPGPGAAQPTEPSPEALRAGVSNAIQHTLSRSVLALEASTL
jgi:hypothetical protein